MKSICQLYTRKTGRVHTPEPFGCMVLLEHNGYYYCLTNAHVLNDLSKGKPFVFLTGDRSFTLGGESLFTRVETGKLDDDRIDMNVLVLESSCVELLKHKGCQFFSIEDINTCYVMAKGDQYLYAGYPASRTELDFEQKQAIATPFYFNTIAVNNNLEHKGYSSNSHVFGKYARNQVVSSSRDIRRGPFLQGMSGSGVWSLYQTIGGFEAELVGVFSEYHDNRSLLIGTHIHLFIDIIKQCVDPTIPYFGIAPRNWTWRPS